MVISLKVAVPGLECRKSDSNNASSFCSPAHWGCVLQRALYLKLGNWDGPLPFISWLFTGEGTLSFPVCKMRTNWIDVTSDEITACKSAL